MEAISLFRQQVKEARDLLEATMNDVTTEQAHWLPPGRAMPIGAHYTHIVMSQDMGLHGLLKGSPPLAATAWAGKTGASELPSPMGPGESWDQWARRLQIDLPALRQYALAVYAASDEYLASLTDDLPLIVDVLRERDKPAR